MNGLFNWALQCFLRDMYGSAVWERVAADTRLGSDVVEPMLSYPPELTRAMIDAAARALAQPREDVLRNLGTYLVSHESFEPLRRLLRFGGVNFPDFLQSLEDVHARGRLVLSDLDLPVLLLADAGPDRWFLTCRSAIPGAAHVVAGLVAAMADDYGTLAVIEHTGSGPEGERISIELSEMLHSEGRHFALAAGGASP